MPAVSKDQQRAAGIALQAKRDGKVDELPAGAAKEMAKSMTEKELDKMASTKLKGLPEKKKEKKNEAKKWAGASLVHVFKEETLELAAKAKENDKEEITTQKSKVDRIDDKKIGNGKSAEDSWTSASGGTAPAIANNARGPMTSNTAGARVAEQVGRTYKDPDEPEWIQVTDNAEEQNQEMDPGVKPHLESIDLTRWQKLAGISASGNGLLQEKEEKKWMQKATDPAKKGALSKKLGIPEDEDIPMETLEKKKKELEKKAEGDKKLTKAERETLGQVQFAINAKRAKKESRSFEDELAELDFLA